ncbi:virulence RhuM family protein, partial [Nitrospira defluvii]|nr:virulence RhuM family protein [Nitrospira defluvii]
TSVDYDPTLVGSIEFFKRVQNKVHWAITGKTAAEIIHSRANSEKDNMGLITFRGSKVRKQDVVNAKNYLNEEELLALNNLVEQYLVFAEGQAMRRISMTMVNWVEKLDGFLTLNDRNILDHAGKVTHQLAKQFSEQEYDKFKQQGLLDEAKAADARDFEQLTKITDQLEKPKDEKG